MSVNNDKVQKTYNGDGVTVDHPIVFDFTSESVIKVYLITIATGAKVLQTITTHYTLDGGPPVNNVNMNVAPTALERLQVIRETPKLQPNVYSGTAFPADSVEESEDNIVRQVQELGESNDKSILLNSATLLSNITLPIEVAHKFFKWDKTGDALENSEAIPSWEVAADYVIGNIIIEDSIIYRCIADHTSAVFANEESNWFGIAGAKGATGLQGEKGIKGDDGPQGIQGVAGANGGNGADGIFSAIASQAEAQAGSDNTKGMTPLRTKEAIATQVPNLSVITDLQAKDTAQDADIAAVGDRVSKVETLITSSKYTGSQRLLNNQATPQPLLGVLGPDGKNNAFTVDADGTKHAEFVIEVWRKDDGEERLVSIDVILLYVNGVWYFGRKNTTKLIGNFDGLTFSLVATGNAVTLYYISDNMAGGNYDVDSRIKWVGTEISIGV